MREAVGAFVVVERELVRLGRRWQTTAARATFAAIVFFLVGTVYTASYAFGELMSVSTLATLGRGVFQTWSGLMFAGVVVMTPVLVGQAVLDEKEDQTLQLLAITRLSPPRILWGTLLSRLVMMETLILAALPVLAVVLSFGGVGPMDMLGSVLHVQVLMLVAGAAATFFGLYARSVIVVLTQTWGWLLGGYIASSIFGAIAAGGGLGVLMANPLTSFYGRGAGVTTVASILVPTLSWGFVAVGVMYVAILCFDTLALGEREADADDADRSAGFWRLERFRKKLGPASILLLIMAPLIFALRAWGGVPYLPSVVAWIWFGAALTVGGVSTLLSSRRATLKRNRKQREKSMNRVGWKRLAAHYQRRGSEPPPRGERDADGSRDVAGAVRSARKRQGRLLSPGQRQVWDRAVAWREVATAAHGRVRRLLFAWYAVVGVLVAAMAVFGGLDSNEAVGFFGVFLLFGTPPLTVLLATSSVVGERRAGTLNLLSVTPMTPGQIITQKIIGIAMLLAPTSVVGGLLLLGGASSRGEALVAAICGLVWFAATMWALAALCLWRALGVKAPSRAWAANIVLTGALVWCLGAGTGFVSVLPDVLMRFWALLVPFGILDVDGDLASLYFMASAGMWGILGGFCHLGAQRSLARRSSEG